jgi:hypothetical protein
MEEKYRQFFIKFRVSTPSGEFWMIRPFETDGENPAKTEGQDLELELNKHSDGKVQFEFDSVLTKTQMKKY